MRFPGGSDATGVSVEVEPDLFPSPWFLGRLSWAVLTPPVFGGTPFNPERTPKRPQGLETLGALLRFYREGRWKRWVSPYTGGTLRSSRWSVWYWTVSNSGQHPCHSCINARCSELEGSTAGRRSGDRQALGAISRAELDQVGSDYRVQFFVCERVTFCGARWAAPRPSLRASGNHGFGNAGLPRRLSTVGRVL